MEMPRVSVIIPVYNAEQYLAECLKSILIQTMTDIEIICVNDGSTDTSLSILEQFAREDQRIIILDQKNQGVGIARNRAMEIATGEFVAFVDPDDLYPTRDVLEYLYGRAKENNVRIAGGSVAKLMPDQSLTSYTGLMAKYIFENDGIVSFHDYQYHFGFWRFIYERKMLIENKIYFPSYLRYQDPPFFVKAMITADKFFASSKIIYHYRVCHKTTVWNVEKFKDFLSGVKDTIALARAHDLQELEILITDLLYRSFLNLSKQEIKITELQSVIDMIFGLGTPVFSQTLQELFRLQKVLEKVKQVNASALEEVKTVKATLQKEKKRCKKIEITLQKSRNAARIRDQKIVKLQKTLKLLKTSRSYRIGRFVTWLPRKVFGKK